MTNRVALALAGVEAFRSLPEASLTALASRCRFVRYDPKQQIIGYREISTNVFFIVSGIVRVAMHSPLGKEISYGDLGTGELFGELAAIDGEWRFASIISITDTIVVAMPCKVFRDALERHASVAESVLKQMTKRLRLYSQRMYELRNLDVRGRLHAELIRMAKDRVSADNTASIAPAPTHAAIANVICAGREAVSRELASLARRGLVERCQNSLVIRDLDRLADMVASALGERRQGSGSPLQQAQLVPRSSATAELSMRL